MMPSGLRYSERALWRETDDERVRDVLARLARVREADQGLRVGIKQAALYLECFNPWTDTTATAKWFLRSLLGTPQAGAHREGES